MQTITENRKRAAHMGLPFFFDGGTGKLLLVFMPHLFSKFSVFVLGDFFSSLLNNATHSILPPCSDLTLLLNLSQVVNRHFTKGQQTKMETQKNIMQT
jgi:hypothetical protein